MNDAKDTVDVKELVVGLLDVIDSQIASLLKFWSDLVMITCLLGLSNDVGLVVEDSDDKEAEIKEETDSGADTV